MSEKLKLKVGGVYEDADGEIVAIVERRKESGFQFIDDLGVKFSSDGESWFFGGADIKKELDGEALIGATDDYALIFAKDKFHMACQEVSKKQALRIFKFLGKHLGYEIKG